MGRPLEPKCRQCRRAGEKLFLKGEKCFTVKCPIVKRNYPPGIHGAAAGKRRHVSEYGLQLREKQKAKAMYRLGERQFFNYYKNAVKSPSNTGEELLRLLERRLDNVVFRFGLANSRDQARQLVSHGHVYVNDRRLDVPSYMTRKGDTITLKGKSQKLGFVVSALAKSKEHEHEWLSFDPKTLTGAVISMPELKETEDIINAKLIVEYYSR